MLTTQDLLQIEQRGITQEMINHQIGHFISDFPPIRLAGPAVAGNGILQFGDQEKASYIRFYREHMGALKVVKFVPASGAASRMFKNLYEFRERYSMDEKGNELFLKDQGFNSVHYLITHLHSIAFYKDLELAAVRHGCTLESLLASKDLVRVIDLILNEDGLQYGQLPKGLLKFHDYPEGARTATEEHLIEAFRYATSGDGTARIHLTISPEHREKFDALIQRVRPAYEKRCQVNFGIGFSIQKPSTDMLAVDEANQPFRNQDGSLLFRPGGHGALLSNLQDIRADLIFVKNIDNIVPDRLREPTVENKELIGGYLLWIRERIHRFLLHASTDVDNEKEIIDFMKKHLMIRFPDDFDNLNETERAGWIFRKLNRPIRVCGMVKNEGEPGGGPFWVKDNLGEISLQIVESSQINLKDPEQASIAGSATHFNPVDLVCCTTDYLGNAFDLSAYVDENTGFISTKSSGGRSLKAQELPGLWNGAMSDWITVFIEVPIITFNPVKTVNDLLRKEHLMS